jgi:hypothetical protein
VNSSLSSSYCISTYTYEFDASSLFRHDRRAYNRWLRSDSDSTTFSGVVVISYPGTEVQNILNLLTKLDMLDVMKHTYTQVSYTLKLII